MNSKILEKSKDIDKEVLEDLLRNGLEDENGVPINFDLIGNINETASAAQVSHQRKFHKTTGEDIDTFLETQQNKNTVRKTAKDMEVFTQFLRQTGEVRLAEIIPPFELNKHIASFLLSVRKLDGTEYEPVSLRAYLSSIERYLKTKNYPVSVSTDIQFQQCREVLKLKQKQLKGMGKGNKPFAADDITDIEINQMYDKDVLGCANPTALLNSLFMICTNHFGMRPGKEVHDLKWGDIELGLDNDSNTEYIVYSQERQTKTRTGANTHDTRKVKPRAYAIGEPSKNPVYLYKMYKEKRPAQMNDDDSPFFLAINKAAKLELTDDEINGWRNLKGAIVYDVNGDDWTYEASMAGMSKKHQMKIGVENQKDTDMEGNEFENTPELKDPKTLVEKRKTYLPGGRVLETVEERVVNGDKMTCTVSAKGSALPLIYTMSRKK